jgi:hypothetical protein
MSGISGGDGGEGVTPFYSGGEERRGEEAVAGVGGFLEGFGHYGEEKRWGAVTFRVLERRWRDGLIPIHYRWPEVSGRRAHATWWWCEGGGGGRCREAGDELEWVGGPEWATG